MRIQVFILITLAVLTCSLNAASSAKHSNIIQSRLRLLSRVRGTHERLGTLGDAAENQSISAAVGESKSWYERLSDILSMQFRTSSMYSLSNNVFNTQEDAQTDSQYAQVAGVSLDAAFNEHWTFSNTFDQSWFYYGRADNATQDFISSTFGQMLSYDRTFFDKKLDVNLPLSWEFSRLFNRATGARTLDTYTYRAATEFTWLCSPWFTPAWSYEYLYQDNGSPTDFVPNKHKHNFNLGLTFVPFKGHKFYLTPSMQYSIEQFIHVVRTDRIWTPTVTATWQPLKYLAFDVIGSYTNSISSQDGSSYKVFTGTLYARLFFDW
jgi:hypothetical protein